MRITELPQAASVAQTDDLAIDVPGGRTYRVPRSILAPAPYIATIPTGQWSGSGSDRYITVTASNVTADAMLYPFYDNASAALLNGPVWVIPAAGSFTIHTSAIPSGTVTISVLLVGIVGEAQYQVLADVYSKSQVDSIVSQSTAYVDCGTVTGSTVTDAIGAAWDAITTYDKTVVGKFTYQGQWMYMAYKYSGSPQYGMMIAVKYNSTPYLMRVTSGAKTYFTFGITQVT